MPTRDARARSQLSQLADIRAKRATTTGGVGASPRSRPLGGDVLNSPNRSPGQHHHADTTNTTVTVCTKKSFVTYLPLILIVLVGANLVFVLHHGFLGTVDPHQRPSHRSLGKSIEQLLDSHPAQAVDVPVVHPYHKGDVGKLNQDNNDLNSQSQAQDKSFKPIIAPNPINNRHSIDTGSGKIADDGSGSVPLSHNFLSRGDGELAKEAPIGAFSIHGTPYCLDTLQHAVGQAPGTYSCHGQGGSQQWEHKGIDGPLRNPTRNLCLGTLTGNKNKINDLVLVDCGNRNARLNWKRIIVPYDHSSAQFRLIGSGEIALTQVSAQSVRQSVRCKVHVMVSTGAWMSECLISSKVFSCLVCAEGRPVPHQGIQRSAFKGL